ncbi:MAG TPA: hypothetical protein VH640_03345 [Bryobacteraceae bacterium]|jgi:hypothetical protein
MYRVVALALASAVVLSAASGLTVERMAMQEFEDGPLLPPDYQFLPGEAAHFTCRLSGYKIDKSDDENQRVKLSWTLEVFDPTGVPIDKPKSGQIEGRVLPEDKNWVPKFLAGFMIPPFAASGDYRVSVQAKDEIGATELHADLTFHVRGRDVQPSATLALRNFRFQRSEDDSASLREPVYRAGDMLWARFDIVGYKFEDNNRYSVDYGLAVEDAAGKRLFAQPEAAAESHDSFYPQRYVPGGLSLNLDKNVAPAMYTLVVTVHDRVGGQIWEERHAFQVR